MFKKDIDLIRYLNGIYHFAPPLLDAGGLEEPVVADYEISIATAVEVAVPREEGNSETVRVPNVVQSDRYLSIRKPWQFIDPDYLILNPEYGHAPIEALPEQYGEAFQTIIMVSVFEHVRNPYQVSDALFKLLKPGGYLINSAPFLFPYHPSPEDNFRYSPKALQTIHSDSGFEWIRGDFHVNYSSRLGIGDTNPANYGAPQAIMASYALCRKPARR